MGVGITRDTVGKGINVGVEVKGMNSPSMVLVGGNVGVSGDTVVTNAVPVDEEEGVRVHVGDAV